MTTPASPENGRQLAGHLLVECLVAQGVTHAFGVPGESYLAVLDGFHAYRDRIRFIVNRQEGGAAFMAEAAGKLTGRPGVAIVTRGPGASNAAIGVHVAQQDSTPMLLLVGQVGSDFRGREALLERKQDTARPRRVGLQLEGKRIAREGAVVKVSSKPVGTVTSGTYAPTLQKSIAMAYIDPALTEVGTPCLADIRGKDEAAVVVALPFYKRTR